ncbi:uncharacterized protein LOC127749185 [Frankliniella occidentalis]|uniref:Uncharacterized protein LOC127749185 n=1 Tax=Frankliniella occidentalis TaxID=133901 RepID=A0A9C6WX02_FRAOC|nr:uncharacterized protein LOC127749185 [Frankliniella occidentalis]
MYAAAVSIAYNVLEDMAELLALRFAQDAASRRLRPATLLRHRRAWLALRDLLQGVMLAPATVTLGVALMMVNAVLSLYYVVNCVMVGAPTELIASLTLASSDLGFLLVAMCSAADGAVIAVNKFARAFELIEPDSVSDYAFAREVSREALSHKLTPVCVAGYWYLSRQTVSSVGLMVVSYLIVLIEFRQQQDSSAFYSNATSRGV